jgi:hypothetical protein
MKPIEQAAEHRLHVIVISVSCDWALLQTLLLYASKER